MGGKNRTGPRNGARQFSRGPPNFFGAPGSPSAPRTGGANHKTPKNLNPPGGPRAGPGAPGAAERRKGSEKGSSPAQGKGKGGVLGQRGTARSERGLAQREGPSEKIPGGGGRGSGEKKNLGAANPGEAAGNGGNRG